MEVDFDPKYPFVDEQDSNAIPRLFEIESDYMPAKDYARTSIFALREKAVILIEEYSCGDYSDDRMVPYLALNFFDRFVSRRGVPLAVGLDEDSNMNLLVLCCITIAWKMRRSAFPIDPFLRRNVDFEHQHIKDVELEILDGLHWRIRSVTPFCFVDYFLDLLEEKDAKIRNNVRHIATENIFRLQKLNRFTEFKPSIIAASSLLRTQPVLLPEDLIQLKSAIVCCRYVRKVIL